MTDAQETAQPESMDSFIARHRLAMTATRIPSRPDRPRDESQAKWDMQAFHFHILIYPTTGTGNNLRDHGKPTLTCLWSCGSGIVDSWIKKARVHAFGMNDARVHWLKHPNTVYAQEYRNAVSDRFKPSLADILDSLAMDSSCVRDAQDYKEFAYELGYSEDSREGERIYHACQKIARDLEALLGRDGMRELLNNVERL